MAEHAAALKVSPSGRRYYATLQRWEPLGSDIARSSTSPSVPRTDQAGIYRACIQGMAGDHRLVLATGKVDPVVLDPLPDGVQAARTQPQLDVLSHAAAFITHAGMGSAAESLRVPTVAIPQARPVRERRPPAGHRRRRAAAEESTPTCAGGDRAALVKTRAPES